LLSLKYLQGEAKELRRLKQGSIAGSNDSIWNEYIDPINEVKSHEVSANGVDVCQDAVSETLSVPSSLSTPDDFGKNYQLRIKLIRSFKQANSNCIYKELTWIQAPGNPYCD
jgi:hypothetical protein